MQILSSNKETSHIFGITVKTECYVDFTQEDLPSEAIALVYNQWSRVAQEDKTPPRELINFRDMNAIIGYLALVVNENPAKVRLKCVLSGPNLTRLLGKDVHGQYLDEVLSPRMLKEPLDAYRHVIATKQPIYMRRTVKSFLRKLEFNCIYLPYSADNIHVDAILTCVVPTDLNLRDVEDFRNMEELREWIEHLERDFEDMNHLSKGPKNLQLVTD